MAWCTECGNLAYTDGWHKPFCPSYETQRRLYIGRRIDQLNDELSRASVGRAMLESTVARLQAENADLLAACKAVYHRMCVLHPHDGGCGWDTDNPLPTLLRDAIAKAKAA